MQEMPNFTEMPEPMRNIMKASIDQARKAFESFIATSQQAMANFETPGNNPAMDGVKQFNEKIAEFTRKNAAANFDFAMKLADAKQVSDVLDMQNNYMRSLMDSYAKQLEELRSLTTRIVQDSAKAAASNTPGMGGTGMGGTGV
jgi:hypothetical protein